MRGLHAISARGGWNPSCSSRGMAQSLLIDQAAARLGVSRRTVYYWIREGRLRTVSTRTV